MLFSLINVYSFKKATNILLFSSLSNKWALVFSFSLGFLFQFLHWGVVLGQFLTWNHPSSSFSLYINLNKWFSHRSRFFLRDFAIWVWLCVVSRLVRRCLISQLVAVFVCPYWNINFSQSITDSINDLDVNVAYLK